MGPAGEQVAAHLRRNGINASALTRKPEGRSVGEAMIAVAHELDGDVLVKGAFTNSRLRQMIFGGATRDVIEKSDLPVILAH
jgi:nucleotide-binding universal stress UspA family protein